MTRFLVAVGVAFLLMQPLLAQAMQPSGMGAPGQTGPSDADCQQVREAVAKYGYAAAKRYAVTHYGKEAAGYGDQCLTKKQKAKG